MFTSNMYFFRFRRAHKVSAMGLDLDNSDVMKYVPLCTQGAEEGKDRHVELEGHLYESILPVSKSLVGDADGL